MGRLQRAQTMSRKAGLESLGTLGSLTEKGIKHIYSLYLHTTYITSPLRIAHGESGWSCATVAMRPGWLSWWMGADCYRLVSSSWLAELGRRGRKDRGRIGRPISAVCTRPCCTSDGRGPQAPQVDRYHVGCHVTARGSARGSAPSENPYQIREKRGSVPSWAPFLGYVLALPPCQRCSEQGTRQLAPAQFLSRRGHWSMGYINAAALHSQSSTDLTISALQDHPTPAA